MDTKDFQGVKLLANNKTGINTGVERIIKNNGG